MSVDVWLAEPGKGIGVLELGAPRDDVLRRLADAGFEVEEDDEELRWCYVEEMDAELTFTEGSRPVLEEIAVSDDRLRLGPIELIDEPVHKIVELLRVAAEETVWTIRRDAPREPKTDADRSPNPPDDQAVETPSAEKLLAEGTLWVRPLGLGLDLVYGDILTVRLRRPDDIPKAGLGSLTPEQRALAARPDPTSHLVGPVREQRRRGSRFQLLAGLALMVGMALVVWRAIDYQRRWNEAPVVEGEVVDVKPPPPEPFPNEYTIVYHDKMGRRHQVIFQRADVYNIAKVGGKVEIRYLPEAPDEPLGPARVPDAWVERYIPWGIGVMVGYFVLQLAVPIVGWAWRKA
jgi:hypothetical protein